MRKESKMKRWNERKTNVQQLNFLLLIRALAHHRSRKWSGCRRVDEKSKQIFFNLNIFLRVMRVMTRANSL